MQAIFLIVLLPHAISFLHIYYTINFTKSQIISATGCLVALTTSSISKNRVYHVKVLDLYSQPWLESNQLRLPQKPRFQRPPVRTTDRRAMYTSILRLCSRLRPLGPSIKSNSPLMTPKYRCGFFSRQHTQLYYENQYLGQGAPIL